MRRTNSVSCSDRKMWPSSVPPVSARRTWRSAWRIAADESGRKIYFGTLTGLIDSLEETKAAYRLADLFGGGGSWRIGRATWLARVENRRPVRSVDPPRSQRRSMAFPRGKGLDLVEGDYPWGAKRHDHPPMISSPRTSASSPTGNRTRVRAPLPLDKTTVEPSRSWVIPSPHEQPTLSHGNPRCAAPATTARAGWPGPSASANPQSGGMPHEQRWIRTRRCTSGWPMTGASFFRWTITVLAIAAAVARAFLPDLTIDIVTAVLLATACVPWAGRLFRTLEIPGFLKVEGHELRKTSDRIEASGRLPIGEDTNARRRPRHVYAFEAVVGDDGNMVLAGLRLELERRLRQIAKSRGVTGESRTLRSVVGQLARLGVIPRDEASALADLLPLLNKAVHGATVDRAALEWALDFGPPLLDALEEHLGKSSIPDLIIQWRNRDGALVQEVGTKLSKALVKAPRAFLASMAKDPESFESWVEGIEMHTFTIYESDDEVEDDLYTAYYEELKTLMQDRLKTLLDSDLHNEASRVLSALNQVTIRRIW